MAEDMEITEVSETEPQTASSLSQEERERIAQLPYEQARDELIQAVRALENGGLSLEDSMKQWELGEALAQRAQSLLSTIRAKLDAAQQAQAQTANTAYPVESGILISDAGRRRPPWRAARGGEPRIVSELTCPMVTSLLVTMWSIPANAGRYFLSAGQVNTSPWPLTSAASWKRVPSMSRNTAWPQVELKSPSEYSRCQGVR